MSASVWNPGNGSSVGTVNAENTYKSQYFVATEGQTVFNITNFAYVPTTESLEVCQNGSTQILTKDYLETSGTSITLVEGARVGDVIFVRGLVGSVASQAAATSAAQAAASANAAQIAASSVTNINNTFTASGNTPVLIGLGNLVVTVPAAKQFIAGQFILLVDTLDNTRYVLGRVISYVGTSLTLAITKTKGAGTIANWDLSVSGVPQEAVDIFADPTLLAQVYALSFAT